MRLSFTAFACVLAVLVISGCSRKSSATGSNSAPASPEKIARVPAKVRRLVISERFKGAQQARLDDTYAVVILADGERSLVPLESLPIDDYAWLTQFAKEHPLPSGKSSMTVVASTTPVKKTIQISKTENGVETVQLCPPNVIRNQIGGTCMIYARVHWLDIAGFPVDLGTIYKIINDTPPDHPWMSPHYMEGLSSIMTGFQTKPVVHRLPFQEDPFDWARKELRQGHPLLAALPKEIWQALPPGFVAEHPWNGGSVGHQIVVNGFTWNEGTRQGTFHVVNSWQELLEFDLTTEAAKGGTLVIEQSLSPIGEVAAVDLKEKVQRVTLLQGTGTNNVYEVETNVGSRRIVAPTESRARQLVEESD